MCATINQAPLSVGRAAERTYFYYRQQSVRERRSHSRRLRGAAHFDVCIRPKSGLRIQPRLPSVLVVKCPVVRLQSCLPEPSYLFNAGDKMCQRLIVTVRFQRSRSFMLNVLPGKVSALWARSSCVAQTGFRNISWRREYLGPPPFWLFLPPPQKRKKHILKISKISLMSLIEILTTSNR